MIFYSEPSMLVRINKNIASNRRLKSFRFDSEGKFETENPRLIIALKRRFKYDIEVVTEEPKEEVIEIKEEALKHCKKCDFTSTNQGELMQHYKNIHPKKV
jgi:hypothetical protein